MNNNSKSTGTNIHRKEVLQGSKIFRFTLSNEDKGHRDIVNRLMAHSTYAPSNANARTDSQETPLSSKPFSQTVTHGTTRLIMENEQPNYSNETFFLKDDSFIDQFGNREIISLPEDSYLSTIMDTVESVHSSMFLPSFVSQKELNSYLDKTDNLSINSENNKTAEIKPSITIQWGKQILH